MTRFSERSFGLTIGTACAVLALAAVWRGHWDAARWLGAAGAVLAGLAVTRPAWLRVPAHGWSLLAYGLGWVNGRILLSLVFFGFITPMGLVARALGKDLLKRRREHGGWTPYPRRLADAKHYERMF